MSDSNSIGTGSLLVGKAGSGYFTFPFYRLYAILRTEAVCGKVPGARSAWSIISHPSWFDVVILCIYSGIEDLSGRVTRKLSEIIGRKASDPWKEMVHALCFLVGMLLFTPVSAVMTVYMVDEDGVFGGSVSKIVAAIYTNDGISGFYSCLLYVLVHRVIQSALVDKYKLNQSDAESLFDAPDNLTAKTCWQALAMAGIEYSLYPLITLIHRTQVYAVLPQLAPSTISPAISLTPADLWDGFVTYAMITLLPKLLLGGYVILMIMFAPSRRAGKDQLLG